MDRLHAMEVFVRVVEASSFSRAAALLHISRTSVTTIVKQLEAHLRVPLLHRTTRTVRPTPEGEAYYAHAIRILADIAELEATTGGAVTAPRGRLRVSVPGFLGRWVVTPALHAFHLAHPEVAITLDYDDGMVDLIGEGVDCAIRLGALESSSSLIGRQLVRMERTTVASPDYLARHDRQANLAALKHHRALHHVPGKASVVPGLSFDVRGETIEVATPGMLSFRDIEAYVHCGLTGAGILQPPRFMVEQQLRVGTLVEILPEWRPPPLPVSAVYPLNRNLVPRVRVFVNWTLDLFARSPYFHAPLRIPLPEQGRQSGVRMPML